ncbi:fibroin heavy chain [Parambassis ranga]|uniref:Fibroin heavy chain n=1 Tax=Parambassis ranga TaxID=210632 RepID=A0A6P7IQX9_9TELE|nr:fibroin heavy chain-like [Parambassis ranga]
MFALLTRTEKQLKMDADLSFSIMLGRALLQTSLVLWLAQQTLQGGVKPQSVSWGRVLPARVTGALGALGSRYGSKAMKTGIGRYAGAQLGVGGYRSLGLGGRTGLKQGGYGTQGAYVHQPARFVSLGTECRSGVDLPTDLGLGLGQGGKRAYGAGLGTLPGYGALGGTGYPGARPGVTAADLGGPEMASLGQAVEDLKREKSRGLGHSYGSQGRALGLEMPLMRRSSGPNVPELHAGKEVKSLDPLVQSSSLGPTTPLDRSKLLGLAVSQAQGGGEPKIKGTVSHEAALAGGGARRQLPVETDNVRSLGSASPRVQSARDYDSSIQRIQGGKDCGSRIDLSEISRYEPLGSETQRTQSLMPHLGEKSKHLGGETAPAQGETFRLPLSQDRDIFSTPQGGRQYLSAAAERQGVKGLVAKGTNGLQIRGTVTVESRSHGPTNRQMQGGLIPAASGTQSLGIASIRGGQEVPGFTADGQDAKLLSQGDVKRSKGLHIPEQTGRNTQATSYIGGAGNYLGASLGAGGYGAGLGQGAYLGSTPGKLGGYGEGATGYLGAMAGNGFGGDAAKALSTGYGNGYSDGYGAGLGYPAELADVAENKAGKNKALSTGAYAGQMPGAYGALGAGLESTGGKYGGGAAQVPYGNAPVIPAGLEGDGGYPYAAQHLSLGAESAKTANKYEAGTGYGAQQTGYGAQLGVTQDGLGEQAGKYGSVNGALGNGYKG